MKIHKVGQANRLINTTKITHEEWIEVRRKGLSGTDIAAICGFSQYKSAIGVYLDKLGQGKEVEDNDFMYWGRAQEPIIAKRFKNETEFSVRKVNAVLQHPEKAWALANIDRLIVVDRGENDGVLEIKTASEYKLKEWEEENVPTEYYFQLQWYLYVTGFKFGYFAALIGGNKYIQHRVERNQEVIDYIVNIAEVFWNENVLKHIPPTSDGSDAAKNDLLTLYPQSNGKTVELPEFENELNTRAILKAEIDSLEMRIAQIDQSIMERMKEAEIAKIGENKVTWKNVSSKRIDSKRLKAEAPEVYKRFSSESSCRRFTIK